MHSSNWNLFLSDPVSSYLLQDYLRILYLSIFYIIKPWLTIFCFLIDSTVNMIHFFFICTSFIRNMPRSKNQYIWIFPNPAFDFKSAACSLVNFLFPFYNTNRKSTRTTIIFNNFVRLKFYY